MGVRRRRGRARSIAARSVTGSARGWRRRRRVLVTRWAVWRAWMRRRVIRTMPGRAVRRAWIVIVVMMVSVVTMIIVSVQGYKTIVSVQLGVKKCPEAVGSQECNE